jgi:hypothetical protein
VYAPPSASKFDIGLVAAEIMNKKKQDNVGENIEMVKEHMRKTGFERKRPCNGRANEKRGMRMDEGREKRPREAG